MSILLNDNLSIQAPKPVDANYGPYASTTAANAAISFANRYVGLTVGIGTTTVSEYWYNGGIADVNLIAKSTGGGSGTVTSVAATVPAFLSVTGSPITTVGTLAISLSGNALPAANGGTGATSLAGASIATYAGVETLTNKRINPRVSTTTSTATLTPDISSFDQYNLTAQLEGLTVAAPTGTPLDGNKLIIRVVDNGTTRSITWNSIYKGIGVTLPTATTANKTLYVGCIYNAYGSTLPGSPNVPTWDVIAVTIQT